jgi:CDP-diacylglycerol--glycerol-3-phosphate 3-phosphatidyltransferase
VARATDKTSRFGAFLDSLLDRYSEAIIFGALIFELGRRGDLALVGGACLALAGSLLVSYARARAEGLGLDCEVGALQRPERVIILGAGLLFPDLLLTPAVWLLAVATNVTVLQRILHVRRLLAAETETRRDSE